MHSKLTNQNGDHVFCGRPKAGSSLERKHLRSINRLSKETAKLVAVHRQKQLAEAARRDEQGQTYFYNRQPGPEANLVLVVNQ